MLVSRRFERRTIDCGGDFSAHDVQQDAHAPVGVKPLQAADGVGERPGDHAHRLACAQIPIQTQQAVIIGVVEQLFDDAVRRRLAAPRPP